MGIVELRNNSNFVCHVCGGSHVVEQASYPILNGISSDARPWPAGARIGTCPDCGIVVKLLDSKWHKTIEQIYRSYAIYHQSKGAEKLSFDLGPDRAVPRSIALLNKLFSVAIVPSGGRILDVGTGTGVLLHALSKSRADIELWAQDLSDNQLPILSRVPGFRGLHVGDLAGVPGRYDLVSLIHVLEHVPNPRSFLAGLRDRLTDTGTLVINVPDAAKNPFDILIVDHCSHFALAQLCALVVSAGYDVIYGDGGLLARELVVFARPSAPTRYVRPDSATVDLDRYVSWLKSLLDKAARVADLGPMAIFGASNAGTWLGAALKDWRGPFVDEDAMRVGNKLLNHNIISPSDVPSGMRVFVPFADKAAERIAARLCCERTPYIIPDSMTA